MSAVYLPVHVQNALEDNRELFPRILAGAPQRQVLVFCQNFRIAGIGKLFLDGSPEPLRFHLHQSGRAFAHFLAHAPEAGLLGSKALPFFDAFAAEDFQGAEEIARRSRRTWARGKEYEEDFLFVEFCMQHACLGASRSTLEALLERYEKALEGSEDFRLEVCKALLDAREDAFNAALEQYLDARSDAWAESEDNGSVAPEALVTEGRFSVEGLSLVRMAERQGLATEPDYLHIPSLARKGRPPIFDARSWERIPVDEG
ncbi:hypothetical protein D7V97_12635 [Corallococcus sp. CA053C]|uniref:Imm49 family immunity protein n=1 Tax=Corallococcus sp. CA053C TaxID=2316732 RepID=UPI000EA0C009|nr:Imm49 family immunity protein [Corallococcus sp. CA053C]RKH10865.1 hypothetical protein D7V97_12635 [Corallococcus sp. CA053C]